MKSEQNWRKLSFMVFKQTSGEKCTKCETATGCTDGGELVGDGEQLLLSSQNRGRLQRKIIGCHSEQSKSLL